MNRTISLGNMTSDPKITRFDSGNVKAEFTLALNRFKEGADYPRFIAWDKKAELIEKYCHKGMKLAIVGHIQTGSYEGKNGKVYTTDIIVDDLEFCEKKSDGSAGQPQEKDEGFMAIPEGLQEELPFA